MRKIFSWLLVFTVIGMCIYGVGADKIKKFWEFSSLLSAYAVVPNLEKKVDETVTAFAPTENTVSKVEIKPTESKQETSSQNTKPPATAKGKILSKFISPYSANLKYNKIYINNKTGQTINVANELKSGTKIKMKKSKEPEVLIMHTHATECFLNENRDYYTAEDKSRTTDNSKNITAVGETIKKQLENAGFSVLHDKTQHDYPSYNGSYTRSKATVQSYLKKYNSIKIVIDLHRDAMPSGNDKIAPTVEIGGKKAAQVMLVMGSQTGNITGHSKWKENFRLAIKLQQSFETNYPGFARSMLLKSAKYNQYLTTGSVLIEIGTDANTFEQALYSGELVGKALAETLNTMK